MKNKIIALALTLLISLPATNAFAPSSENQKIEQNKTITATFFLKDGSIKNEQIELTPDEIEEIQEIISKIMETIQSTDNQNITDIIKDILNRNRENNLIQKMLNILENRPLQKRAFIISDGYGSRIDIQRKTKLNLFKSITLWHYFGLQSLNRSETIIVDPMNPITPEVSRIKGWQMGTMRRFIGIHLDRPGNILDKKHVFFMGYAYKVRTLDLPEPLQMLTNKIQKI